MKICKFISRKDHTQYCILEECVWYNKKLKDCLFMIEKRKNQKEFTLF